MSGKVTVTNIQRATAAWGADMPAWVRLLASAADATNQRKAGEKINRNAGVISRVLNRNYAGSYPEIERLVRAAWGNEDVLCPVWNDTIPLASCMNLRRKKGFPGNVVENLYYQACPTCPNNTDTASDQAEEAAPCAA
ncbi:MAG: hypothetical protein A2792_19765 [Sphingomonadales bacterium RIFCSPHIGHO2_01_FULL_65_20]|uniref:hypothetical protein n=1 Tax=Blastomonas sp. TaxID=1909299 RepID=UPI0008BD0D65|nr:hypothetical protein [Blastomonas sp.]OHC96614.1 MAG: hypothetical protein A2792_19765 [Sphingomonadales bacterium RIFCSPHIGHO2_01_FULL_65_20]